MSVDNGGESLFHGPAFLLRGRRVVRTFPPFLLRWSKDNFGTMREARLAWLWQLAGTQDVGGMV